MSEKISITIERPASNSSTESEIEKKTCEEGDSSAWLTLLGSILVYYSSFGILNSFGFFQNYYGTFLAGSSSSTIAFIGTLQMALANILASLSGALCDTYGVKYLYLGSGTGTSLALVALSFSKAGIVWPIFLIQGLMMGITIAFGAQPALTVVGQHFKHRRAFAMGILATGTAMGGICYPILFNALLPVIGFSWVLRIAAIKSLTCYLIAIYISESKPTGKSVNWKITSILDFRGFTQEKYSVLSLGAWFAQLGVWVPAYYMTTYCEHLYPQNKINGYLLPLMNGTSIFGMILGGILGDKIGRLNTLWPTVMLSGLTCLFLWLLAPSMSILILFVCLYGFASGGYSALLPSSISEIVPNEKLGARIGAFYSVVAISSLIGTPIGGALVGDREKREGWRGLILFAGGSLIVGSVIMLVSRLIPQKRSSDSAEGTNIAGCEIETSMTV